MQNAFDDVTYINKEMAIVKQDEKYGVVNISGETKIDFNYDALTYTNGNYFIARQDEKYGVIAIDGSEKLPFESINMTYVSQGDFIIADYTENRKVNFKDI